MHSVSPWCEPSLRGRRPKQSRAVARWALDCFVAPLLAMTSKVDTERPESAPALRAHAIVSSCFRTWLQAAWTLANTLKNRDIRAENCVAAALPSTNTHHSERVTFRAGILIPVKQRATAKRDAKREAGAGCLRCVITQNKPRFARVGKSCPVWRALHAALPRKWDCRLLTQKRNEARCHPPSSCRTR